MKFGSMLFMLLLATGAQAEEAKPAPAPIPFTAEEQSKLTELTRDREIKALAYKLSDTLYQLALSEAARTHGIKGEIIVTSIGDPKDGKFGLVSIPEAKPANTPAK